jgi:diguanylate cyclase (GGDEF)-like protein
VGDESRDQPIRMLIVEDAEDDAFLVYAQLRARGVAVDWRRVDRPEAMAEQLAGGDWDVILCDHNMPGFDSMAALQLLKGSGKDIPFIIYSGEISDQQALLAMHEGVQDYIEKGNIARLLPVIERELRNAAARRVARQADSRIQALANYDALSALPNQSLFCALVTEHVLACEQRRHGGAGLLFYLDLDRFLRINTSFGYETGNEIMRELAHRLQACVPTGSLVARLPGDSFVVFIPGGPGDHLEDLAGRLQGIFDEPVRKGAIELFVSASIGIARMPDDGSEIHELLMNAETAMARVKRGGGNGWLLYRRDMNANSGERVAMEADLRRAIGRQELSLLYQPCIDAGSGRIVSVEALARWHHPRWGLVVPDRFMPVAAESGAMIEIGEWALRTACAQGRRWADRGWPMDVAVNISAIQFAQPRLLEVVSRTLAETGFEARRLQLEITESALMEDVQSTVGMLRAFKHMGVRISVDDFGTGYSSLSYLKRFPIDVLKIDKSFVRDVPGNEDDAAIVRAIIALARALRLTTVAEGVETREQVEFLRREQCDRFQGFLFAEPLDVAALEGRLADMDATG